MHKKIKIIKLIMMPALIVFLLMLGCKPGNNPDYPITDKDFQKGTSGLEFNFIPNAPPDSLFEESDFEIAANVWNKGAYTAGNVYITANIESDYMCILDDSGRCTGFSDSDSKTLSELDELRKKRTDLIVEINRIKDSGDLHAVEENIISQREAELADLEISINAMESQLEIINKDLTKTIGSFMGRGITAPDGAVEHVNFNAKALKLDLLSVQHTSPVILTACYDYQTIVTEDFCIDPDQTSDFEKVCAVEDIELKDQGSPVAVTKIEPRIIPQGDNIKVQFLIYVKNKGDGQVISQNKLKEACSSAKLGSKDWNMVTLSEFGFSNENYFYRLGDDKSTIECSPNPLRLVDAEDFIRCTIDNSKLNEKYKITKSTPPFTTQSYIRLDFGYLKTISKNVVIESAD